MNAANTRDTIDISLIRILSDGPEVSLNGSPTVSPMTLAACASEPLPPKAPFSINFNPSVNFTSNLSALNFGDGYRTNISRNS